MKITGLLSILSNIRAPSIPRCPTNIVMIPSQPPLFLLDGFLLDSFHKWRQGGPKSLRKEEIKLETDIGFLKYAQNQQDSISMPALV